MDTSHRFAVCVTTNDMAFIVKRGGLSADTYSYDQAQIRSEHCWRLSSSADATGHGYWFDEFVISKQGVR